MHPTLELLPSTRAESLQHTSDATNAQEYADTFMTIMRDADGSQHANRIRQTHRCAELRAVANLVARRAPCSTVLVTSGERAMKQSMLRLLLCIDCTAQQQCIKESLYSCHQTLLGPLGLMANSISGGLKRSARGGKEDSDCKLGS